MIKKYCSNCGKLVNLEDKLSLEMTTQDNHMVAHYLQEAEDRLLVALKFLQKARGGTTKDVQMLSNFTKNLQENINYLQKH